MHAADKQFGSSTISALSLGGSRTTYSAEFNPKISLETLGRGLGVFDATPTFEKTFLQDSSDARG